MDAVNHRKISSRQKDRLVEEVVWGAVAAATAYYGGELLGAAFGGGVGAAEGIATPFGLATQEASAEALALREAVRRGAPIFRQGKFGIQETGSPQFWGGQNPATTAGYAEQYGMSGSGADWIMQGTVRPGTRFVTRGAPGLGSNPGGSVEVVTNPGGVRLNWFHTR